MTVRRKFCGQMWAVRWLDCAGRSNPHPAGQHGAWMLCCTKSLAELKRTSSKQIITRVRVVILPSGKNL